MTNIANLTASQLHQIIAIKEQIEALRRQIESIAAGGSGGEIPIPAVEEAPTTRRRRVSAAGRARMAAAQQARWATIKGTGAKPAKRGKRRITAAGRAAMSAAGKARWAKFRA